MPGHTLNLNPTPDTFEFEFGPPESPVEGEFSGHLNVTVDAAEGEPYHAVGEGVTTLPGFSGEVNFVQVETPQGDVVNAVAHTDEGGIHLNTHSGPTGPVPLPFDILI